MSQGPVLRKYGVETTINFVLFEIDGVDFRVDAADSGANCSVMKDEGAEATCENDFTDEGTGYSLVLTATEMQAARIVVYVIDAATKVWLDTSIIVETYGNASAMHAFDLDLAEQTVDVAKISGDATAADNLESQYDTTGLTGDAFPATQAQVGNIGSSSGGSLSFQVETDNAITDTIDNAAAVDKGSGLVGIPVTGHAFTANFQVTIASTTNYNGSFTVISQTTNEVVITATFVSETFGGTETIISTIKTIAKVGTEAGTFANTEAQDASYHVLTNAGDNLDWVYQIDVGGGRTATQIEFHGYLTGNNDTVNIQAYDFVGADWETRFVLQGTSQATDQTEAISLLSKHTGTTGLDIGKVLIRFVDATAAGHVLGVDELLIEAVGIGQSVGYASGQIWVDTVNGTAGTESFVNGVAEKPSLTWADALTLSAAVGLTDFHIINGSTITLSATSDNFSLFGDNWILDLNGQQIAGAHFEGAKVSGVSSGAGASFIKGEIDAVTLDDDTHVDEVSLVGPITVIGADCHIDDCHHAGTGAVVIDFGAAVGSTTVHMHGYEGNVETQNMGDSGTDILHLDGHGTFTANSNGAGGTVHLRGLWKVTANNATVNYDDVNTSTALLNAAQAEPGQGAPAVNETPMTKLAYMFKWARNKSDNDGAEVKHYADDGSTVDQKRTLASAGGTVTRGEMGTGA